MTPRFQNPHFLPESTKRVSRAEIQPDSSEERDNGPKVGTQINILNELLSNSIDAAPELPLTSSRKRRKIQAEDDLDRRFALVEPVSFRLVSDILPPILLSLQPPPPPPSLSREPDAEDNELQSASRKEKAEKSSIDYAWLIQESRHKDARYKKRNPAVLKGDFPSPTPQILILSSLQQFRRTRPPVPLDQLLNHPYKHGGLQVIVEALPKSMECPTVQVSPTPSDFGEGKRSRNRRRVRRQERPPPQFWRPKPSWTGKCLGYAYGYPASFAALEDWDQYGTLYRRDTMGKATLL